MKVSPTEIDDVKLIEPAVFTDARGYFFEVWRTEGLRDAGIDAVFVQENRSRSLRGVLRGLHYQVRQPQGKLISVVAGRIFDVAVDLRRGSATFGRWVGRELSGADRAMLWIPVGFAHGFLTLSDSADVIYACTDYYAPDSERTIAWNDPDLAIAWPLESGGRPLVSGKDAKGAAFKAADLFP